MRRAATALCTSPCAPFGHFPPGPVGRSPPLPGSAHTLSHVSALLNAPVAPLAPERSLEEALRRHVATLAGDAVPPNAAPGGRALAALGRALAAALAVTAPVATAPVAMVPAADRAAARATRVAALQNAAGFWRAVWRGLGRVVFARLCVS